MTNLKNNCFKFASVGALALTAISAVLIPVTASAALVTGNATISIDNAAFTTNSIYSAYVEKHWGESDNNLAINAATTGGTTLSLNGITDMLFPVNSNTTTTVCDACSDYGRTLQATTMDASDTSNGQIGLSGAWRINSVIGIATPYDFRLVKTAGTWNISTYDNTFRYQNFLQLTNVSESLNPNGELLLSGDLQITALWATLTGTNTSAVIGRFELAPVPVPAAVWMFGSGLLGLFGVSRRKSIIKV